MLVLIAGITGQLGTPLAEVALFRGLSIRGLGRDTSKVKRDLLPKLESFVEMTSWYDVPALDKAVAGVDAVICAYNPNPLLDLDASLLLLRAAERAGIKVFIASGWNNDWTKNKFGDMELYDAHIAFEHQAAITSPIWPVYIFTGAFDYLLFNSFGPGRFNTDSGKPKFEYWGDWVDDKNPWSALPDIAEWTIEILINGDGVQEGKGGFFRIRSGEVSLRELAAAHKEITGVEVDLVRQGSVAELEATLAEERKEKGRGRFWEYMSLSAALMYAKGVWAYESRTILDHVKKPTALYDVLRQQLTAVQTQHS